MVTCIVGTLVCAPCALAQVTDSEISAILQQLAASAQPLPLTVAYEVCPAEVLTATHRVQVSVPLLISFEVDAARISLTTSAAAIRIQIPEVRAMLSSTPQAFQQARDADLSLNAADEDALIALLGEHSKLLAEYFTEGAGRSEIAKGAAESLASRLLTRIRALNDGRMIEAEILDAPDANVSVPPLQLCANTAIAPHFPGKFTDDVHLARGAVPLDDAPETAASQLREYLKNAAGRVIAYREIDATTSTPIGSFRLRSAPIALAPTGSNGEKILNGTLVPQGKMPWAAAFMRTSEDGKPEAFCGGSVIDRQWIVTAAHCRVVEGGEVIIGRVDLTATGGVMRKVKRVWRHAAFGKAARYDSDIALVQLSTDVSVAAAILGGAPPAENSPVTVAGWGATQEGGHTVQLLSSVDLDVEPQDTCVLRYDGTNAAVTDNMFCASKAAERKDACQGDSGGGSFSVPKQNRLELVGIVSFGKGCATRGFPGVYTKLAPFRTWLDEVRQAAGVQ